MMGLAFAIAACALWALSFISPVILEQFSPYAVTLGRYGAFGLFSLALVPFAKRHLRGLSRSDWLKAALLSIVGHMVYYLFLATAIQMSDVPGPTIVIGLLPLTLPIFANLRRQELPWRSLLMPLLGIGAGLFLVNLYEYRRIRADSELLRYAAGIALAFAALGCWTWYGVINAAWLRSRPQVTATGWTMAQGIVLLPIVAVAALLAAAAETGGAAISPGHRPWDQFVLVSLVVGISSSWLATLCWSRASRLLPTTSAGQLIVFVTIAAVIYGSIYRGTLPSTTVTLGVALLAAAVALGVRAMQRSIKS